MKVMHILPALNVAFGGPPQGLANLVRAQARRGDEVTVLPCTTDHGPQTLQAGREGNLLVHEPATDSKLFWYDGKLKRRIREAARGQDLVHIHGSWRYHLLGAAGVAREYGIPYIVRPAGNMGRVSRRN